MRIKKIKSLIVKINIAIALLIAAFDASAECFKASPEGIIPQRTIPASAFIIPRDAPVGTIIGIIKPGASEAIILNCPYGSTPPPNTTYNELVMFTTPSSIPGQYNAPYYDTNIPGVGLSFEWFAAPARPIGGDPGTITPSFGNITLVKTGDISPGVLSSGLFASVHATDYSVIAYNLYINGSTITQSGCTITTPNLTFPIGNILVSRFSTYVGAIPSGAENTQTLGLDCDRGLNVYVSLKGTQNPDVSATSVLALTGQGEAGVAQGVGVQIIFNSVMLAVNGNTPMIMRRGTDGSKMTFPFIARYYQTKTKVTTGRANASATLELTYQ